VLFPGNAADKSEDEVLATLDSLKLTINCFSRSDFQQILDAKAVPLRWELSVAIGPIRDRVEAGTLRLGYTVADFVPSVTMYSNPIWTIKRFADGSSLDVDGSLTVRDMIGGACRLEVNSIPPSTTAPSLMSALARGSACIFIDFGAGLSTQLWFLGAAPLFGDIDRPEQWGLISLKWREKSGDAFCGRPPL
jgi:hypothetical protein